MDVSAEFDSGIRFAELFFFEKIDPVFSIAGFASARARITSLWRLDDCRILQKN
jgi:hypothetical protein